MATSTEDQAKYSHEEFRALLKQQFIKDAIFDAAIATYFCELAPLVDGSYSALKELDGDDQKRKIEKAEADLIRALHVDPNLLISEPQDEDKVRNAVDLTNVDIKAEMKKLEPEISKRWSKLNRDWASMKRRWERVERETRYNQGSYRKPYTSDDEDDSSSDRQSDSSSDRSDSKSADDDAKRKKPEFVPLAKASAEAQIGVPSYDFWPSLAAASNSKLTSLHRLSEAVREERALASTFVCGGQISAPVALYWDTPTYHHGSASKIVFPLLRTARDVDKTNDLDQLVARLASDAQPATFGRGKEDVLDESYRRAKKLDREQFTTSFHPADHGILDDIAQMLLPTMLIGRGAGEGELEKRGVRAELWKLNIYSGPRDKFHSHVDTPRSADQFGSLVVCLPYPHEGGQLIVRHGNHTRSFNWGSAEPGIVQWAAFYSDCEHEILTVTAGHRITLTYNLYISERVGSIIGGSPITDVKALPLYSIIKDALHDRNFLPSGGVLGFGCAHHYAHTNDSATVRLPGALKGVDMALYAIFHAIGLPVEVLPIKKRYSGIGGVDHTGTVARGRDYPWDEERERLEKYRQTGYMLPQRYPYTGDNAGRNTREKIDDLKLVYKDTFIEFSPHFKTRLATLLQTRKIEGVERNAAGTHVADTFLEQEVIYDNPEQTQYGDVLALHRPHQRLHKVHWLTQPSHSELALAYMAYGNQSTLETVYTCAALLVVVPPWSLTRGDEAALQTE